MDTSRFENIIEQFEPITLAEMDNVKLMDRTDTKFVFRIDKLKTLLTQLASDYKILSIDGILVNEYDTMYFDTSDFKFFNDHQRGKTNRIKVRIRTYCSSMINFFEIKRKNNKGRTQKSRIRSTVNHSIDETNKQFLESNCEIKAENLSPKLIVKFRRITLVNKTIPERLTIDQNLTYELPDGTKTQTLNDIVIAEVKQNKSNRSQIKKILHDNHIYKSGFSKYCFGIIFLYNNIKLNNFKLKLLKLNKLRNEKNLSNI